MVALIFVYMAMHCECMPWCLLNIKELGCGTELLLRELKEILLFFRILGLEFLFTSYFLAAVIPIFLFSRCHLSLDTLHSVINHYLSIIQSLSLWCFDFIGHKSDFVDGVKSTSHLF